MIYVKNENYFDMEHMWTRSVDIDVGIWKLIETYPSVYLFQGWNWDLNYQKSV